MACVLAMRGVGLSDRHDCGMYREVVTLVRPIHKLNRPIPCVISDKSTLIV